MNSLRWRGYADRLPAGTSDLFQAAFFKVGRLKYASSGVRSPSAVRKAAELEALLESRQKLLQNAISDAARSDQIPSLVQSLDERIGPHGKDVPAFEQGRSWALSEAEALDPRVASLAHLNEWIEKFRLHH